MNWCMVLHSYLKAKSYWHFCLLLVSDSNRGFLIISFWIFYLLYRFSYCLLLASLTVLERMNWCMVHHSYLKAEWGRVSHIIPGDAPKCTDLCHNIVDLWLRACLPSWHSVVLQNLSNLISFHYWVPKGLTNFECWLWNFHTMNYNTHGVMWS